MQTNKDNKPNKTNITIEVIKTLKNMEPPIYLHTYQRNQTD